MVVRRGLPGPLDGPELGADSGAVAGEELEIAHGGMAMT